MRGRATWLTAVGLAVAGLLVVLPRVLAQHEHGEQPAYDSVDGVLTYAPEAPPPITRKTPAVVKVTLDSGMKTEELGDGLSYAFWTFNDRVPGPFIRARRGDVLEIHVTNSDKSGMPHNIDLHAVTGPGGGATVTTVVEGEERIGYFKLMHPGLFIYHCAAPPVMDHIANGMYGLILVEPERGLPQADREFYVLQSEFYAVPAPDGSERLVFSHEEGLAEHPRFVVFNGQKGALIGEGALTAETGDRVRIFFGNAGPNLISSFHVIGEIFDNVYREADLVSPPARSVQTTLVPPGGAAVVEFTVEVPGTYTLVDHAIFRVEKGAVGYLQVEGEPRDDLFASDQDPVVCPGCMVHP
ncbi:MAG TPA: copper-containing nitrite reductase [bacterium]